MKILLLDYISNSGGAQSISNYINKEIAQDKNNEWLVVTSNIKYNETNNVKNLIVPNVRKNYIRRFLFENIELQKIKREYKPDLIFNMHNALTPGKKKNQIIYMHQAMPFVSYSIKEPEGYKDKFKFKLLKYKLRKDASKAKGIIVQTNFMKEIVSKYNGQTIKVMPALFKKQSRVHSQKKGFIFPTNTQNYKRFDLILKVAKYLKEISPTEDILVTVRGNETEEIRNLYNITQTKDLPIKFIGYQKHESVQSYFEYRNLLFTSELESFGIPLIEAMSQGCKILALKKGFSEELTNSYKQAYLFEENNIEKVMKEYMIDNSEYVSHFVKEDNLLAELRKRKIIE